MTSPAPGRAIAPPPPPPKPSGGQSIVIATPSPDELFTGGGDIEGWWVNVAGPPKYGKTSMAAGAPRPVFIMTDRGGLKSVPKSTPRRVPETWPDVLTALCSLRDKPHNFGTVVLDTTFKAEALVIKHICEKDGKDVLRKVGGGFGAGYDLLVAEINKVVDVFFTLNARGIHTIAIHQVELQTVKAAELDDYERTALALQKKTALIWAAGADVNMYVQPEVRERDRIDCGKDKEDRVKVEFTGRAICHVRSAAGIEAGNRLFLDSPMTYSWAALEIGAAQGAELKERLFAHLATLSTVDRAAADWRLNQAGWSREAALAEINGTTAKK